MEPKITKSNNPNVEKTFVIIKLNEVWFSMLSELPKVKNANILVDNDILLRAFVHGKIIKITQFSSCILKKT